MTMFLIAEIGINHNGDMAIAKKLIAEAKEAGFDAVKFQKRTIDVVYTAEYLESFTINPVTGQQGSRMLDNQPVALEMQGQGRRGGK